LQLNAGSLTGALRTLAFRRSGRRSRPETQGEALSRVSGEYGAEGEIELRQVFEMEPAALAEQPQGV
jgi:hypothetical protein